MIYKIVSLVCSFVFILGCILLPSITNNESIVLEENIVAEPIKNIGDIFIESKLNQNRTYTSSAGSYIVENEIEEDSRIIDYGSFNASYNKLAATMQLELGEEHEEQMLEFIFNSSIKAGYDNLIPNVSTYDELIEYFVNNETYYKGSMTCLPMPGDIILFDGDANGVVDDIEVVHYRDGYMIYTVGIDDANIVVEAEYELGDGRVFGICRPNYELTRMIEYRNNDFTFNAVDTVVTIKDQYYADVLAENGIEVIARYINPEGRTPLSKEEAQLFFNAGIRVMMIYEVDADDPYRGYELGYKIGTKALEYARNLDAPAGTPIFFCCDCTPRPLAFHKVAEFLCGVRDAMQDEYSIGLYGGYYVTEAMYNIGLIDAYWQCWGFSDRYLSDNYDILQWSNGTQWFDKIPYLFDANHVKNVEAVSYILTE